MSKLQHIALLCLPVRTLPWRADACNPETGTSGIQAVPRKGVVQVYIVPDIAVNVLTAFHEALFRAGAS